MAIIAWDKNHILVGNYFRVNGRNTPEGNKPYVAILRMSEGAAGPQGWAQCPSPRRTQSHHRLVCCLQHV